MSTERGRSPSTTFVFPANTLELSIGDITRTIGQVDARLRIGDHPIWHKQVRFYYDALDDVPAIVVSAGMQFVDGLARFAAARRLEARGKQPLHRVRFPDWPPPLRDREPYDPITDY